MSPRTLRGLADQLLAFKLTAFVSRIPRPRGVLVKDHQLLINNRAAAHLVRRVYIVCPCSHSILALFQACARAVIGDYVPCYTLSLRLGIVWQCCVLSERTGRLEHTVF